MKGNHLDCTNWEYDTHPKRHLVKQRCQRLVSLLNRRPHLFDGFSTLRGHWYMFRGLPPVGCQYLAGNYRGSNFPCLRHYGVGVGNDKRVGTPPQNVDLEMKIFEAQLGHAIKSFAEDLHKAGGFDQKILLSFVAILAKFLVIFFTIHPYANGNGHNGRLLVLVLLKRFNLDPVSWPVDESPPYGHAIVEHRNGNPTPLQNFILDRMFS